MTDQWGFTQNTGPSPWPWPMPPRDEFGWWGNSGPVRPAPNRVLRFRRVTDNSAGNPNRLWANQPRVFIDFEQGPDFAAVLNAIMPNPAPSTTIPLAHRFTIDGRPGRFQWPNDANVMFSGGQWRLTSSMRNSHPDDPVWFPRAGSYTVIAWPTGNMPAELAVIARVTAIPVPLESITPNVISLPATFPMTFVLRGPGVGAAAAWGGTDVASTWGMNGTRSERTSTTVISPTEVHWQCTAIHLLNSPQVGQTRWIRLNVDGFTGTNQLPLQFVAAT